MTRPLLVALILMAIAGTGCEDDDGPPSRRPADLDFSGVWLNSVATPVYTLIQRDLTVAGTANVSIGAVADHFTVTGWVRERGIVLTLIRPPGSETTCGSCTLPETRCVAFLFDSDLNALEMNCIQDAHRCCGTHFEFEFSLSRGEPPTPSSRTPERILSSDQGR